jgi:hypothetical protein
VFLLDGEMDDIFHLELVSVATKYVLIFIAIALLVYVILSMSSSCLSTHPYWQACNSC